MCVCFCILEMSDNQRAIVKQQSNEQRACGNMVSMVAVSWSC